jgi:hypothetical protein
LGDNGRAVREAGRAIPEGKPLKIMKPMGVTGMKQGRRGYARSNASRG